MTYPGLKKLERRERFITTFGGLERGGRTSPGSFTDMRDMTADKYPQLAVRAPRAKWSVSPAGGIFADNGDILTSGESICSVSSVNGAVVFCTDRHVYADGVRLDVTLDDIAPQKHRAIPFGKNFFICPDGIYAIEQNGTYRFRRAKYSLEKHNVLVTLCSEIGTELNFDAAGDELPVSGSDGERFLVTGDGGNYLYTYADGGWGRGVRVCLALSAAGIGAYAYEGERTSLRGMGLVNDKIKILLCASGSVTADISCRLPEEIITAEGALMYSTLTLRKEMPEADFICEHNNRLWGCRYGDDGRGGFVNEIFASEQGDPVNWNTFEGISTDSYRASLGCSGGFTGACSLGGEVLFFKQEHIVRVSGSTPSDFYVSTVSARGVEKGAEDTLVILNEKAFYRSAEGITVYDGTLPYIVSSSLGETEYTAVCAGRQGGKYYLKAVCEGQDVIFVFDTRTGLWHCESDRENTVAMVSVGGRLFAFCHPAANPSGRYGIWAMQPGQSTAFDIFRFTPPAGAGYTYTEERLKDWYAETGNICVGEPGTRYVRSLSFRLSSDGDAVFNVSLRCSDGRVSRNICSLRPSRPGTVTVRVNTPRCDGFAIRIGGSGGCAVQSMDIITEKTSEVNRYG